MDASTRDTLNKVREALLNQAYSLENLENVETTPAAAISICNASEANEVALSYIEGILAQG